MTNPVYGRFKTEILNASPNFKPVAKQFPKEMKSFEMDQEGRFKVVYDQSIKGEAQHKDPQWGKLVNGANVELKGEVTGQLDAKTGTMTLDKGCASGSKKWGWLNVKANITEVKAVEGNPNLKLATDSSLINTILNKVEFVPQMVDDFTWR